MKSQVTGYLVQLAIPVGLGNAWMFYWLVLVTRHPLPAVYTIYVPQTIPILYQYKYIIFTFKISRICKLTIETCPTVIRSPLYNNITPFLATREYMYIYQPWLDMSENVRGSALGFSSMYFSIFFL